MSTTRRASSLASCGIAHDITRRKETENNLLLITERLSLATSVAAVGVWEWDVANSAMAWDDTMAQIYGFQLAADKDPYKQWSEHGLPGRSAVGRRRTEKNLGAERARDGRFSHSPLGRIHSVTWRR